MCFTPDPFTETLTLFQTMLLKLQPASGTHLPPYNPLLPPAATSQVLLLANPQQVSAHDGRSSEGLSSHVSCQIQKLLLSVFVSVLSGLCGVTHILKPASSGRLRNCSSCVLTSFFSMCVFFLNLYKLLAHFSSILLKQDFIYKSSHFCVYVFYHLLLTSYRRRLVLHIE